MFHIRLATMSDRPTIIGLIDEAADWLRTKDTDQWATPWPNREERDARVERGLRDRVTWIVEDRETIVEGRGTVVATVTCRPDSRSGLWKDSEVRQPAAYMSRLVINRNYAKKNIGADLTDWVGARARDKFGAEFLRIDVWTTNVRLHFYYEGHGFKFVRFYDDAYYPSAALYYKPTENIRPAAVFRFDETSGVPAAAAMSPAEDHHGVLSPSVGSRALNWHLRHRAGDHGRRPGGRDRREDHPVTVSASPRRSARRNTAVYLAQLVTLVYSRRSSRRRLPRQ